MHRNLEYQITKEDDGKSVLTFLRERGYSSKVIVHLKKTPESIQKNGVWVYVREVLHEGDFLNVQITENQGSLKIVPMDLPLAVVYEDEDILLVDKPADMPIHPSLHNYENTLANAVAYYYAKQGIAYTFRCITRLDRDTTGLVLLAKNMLSAGILSGRMKRHEIRKEYLAVAEGVLPDKGSVFAPIARTQDSAISRCVDFERGESACTDWQLQKTDGSHSLLLLRPQTGRTHQIRVHMQYLGHPLAGDFLYGDLLPETKHEAETDEKSALQNAQTDNIKRQALHCCRLTFAHPVTGEPMCFQSELPKDMRFLIGD